MHRTCIKKEGEGEEKKKKGLTRPVLNFSVATNFVWCPISTMTWEMKTRNGTQLNDQLL
jgi:hypothetical protein